MAGQSCFSTLRPLPPTGLPDSRPKPRAGRVREDDYNTPTTMYGCNKLYCEQLGRYYARFYKQLAAEATKRPRRLPLCALPGADFSARPFRPAELPTTRRR